MSYRGKPSKGCQLCRQRKVKCDEVKPVCSRCAKSSHECVYKDAFDLMVRDQTAIAERKAKDSWRQRATKPPKAPKGTVAGPSQPMRASEPPQRVMIIRQSSTSPPRSLTPSLEMLAINRFFYDFTLPQDGPNPNPITSGFLPFLPDLWRETRPDSAFSEALNAVALSNFSGRFKSQQAKLMSAQTYGNALHKTARALQDPKEARSDNIMAATVLMALYELLGTNEANKSYANHRYGASTLMLMRNSGYPGDKMIGFFVLIYTQILMTSLTACEKSPIPFEVWEKIFPWRGPYYQLLKLMHTIADLASRIKPLLDLSGLNTSNLQKLESQISDAQMVDLELQMWEDSLDEDWRPTLEEHKPEDLPFWAQQVYYHPGAPSKTYSYPSTTCTMAWNLYRTSRVRLNHYLQAAIATCGAAGRLDLAETLDDTDALLKKLVEEICETVPWYICDGIEHGTSAAAGNVRSMRGYFMLWPLVNAEQCLQVMKLGGDDVDAKIRWIRHVLRIMADDLSIAKAGTFLATGKISIGNVIPASSLAWMTTSIRSASSSPSVYGSTSPP